MENTTKLLQKTIAQIQKLNITIPKSYTKNIQNQTTEELIEKLQDLIIRKSKKILKEKKQQYKKQNKKEKQNKITIENTKAIGFGISLYNNTPKIGDIENFGSLSINSVDIEKMDIKNINTNDFLSINKKAIVEQSQDYQKYLFFIFYKQAYNCYEYNIKEYKRKGQKLKVEILENRLTSTIDKILYMYSENKMQEMLIRSRQQIEVYTNDREIKARKTKQEYKEEYSQYLQDKSPTQLDRLNNEYIINHIINTIGILQYKLLIDYIGKEEVKTGQEMTQISRIKSRVKKIKELVA